MAPENRDNVVPLRPKRPAQRRSHTPGLPRWLQVLVTGLLLAALLIGLAIALMVWRATAGQASSAVINSNDHSFVTWIDELSASPNPGF
ncbi:MAG: hypothetical protein ACFCBW_19060 [Candidatus Competibacterales bacterium]